MSEIENNFLYHKRINEIKRKVKNILLNENEKKLFNVIKASWDLFSHILLFKHREIYSSEIFYLLTMM